MFSFVYQLGSTLAAVTTQRPVGNVKNTKQNFTNEGTPQSVAIAILNMIVCNPHNFVRLKIGKYGQNLKHTFPYNPQSSKNVFELHVIHILLMYRVGMQNVAHEME